MNFWLQDLSREVQLFIMRTTSIETKCLRHDRECRLKWEFVLELHLINC